MLQELIVLSDYFAIGYDKFYYCQVRKKFGSCNYFGISFELMTFLIDVSCSMVVWLVICLECDSSHFPQSPPSELMLLDFSHYLKFYFWWIIWRRTNFSCISLFCSPIQNKWEQVHSLGLLKVLLYCRVYVGNV